MNKKVLLIAPLFLFAFAASGCIVINDSSPDNKDNQKIGVVYSSSQLSNNK